MGTWVSVVQKIAPGDRPALEIPPQSERGTLARPTLSIGACSIGVRADADHEQAAEWWEILARQAAVAAGWHRSRSLRR